MPESTKKPDKRRNHGSTEVRPGPSRRREHQAVRLHLAGATPHEIANTRDPESGQPLYRTAEAARAAVARGLAYMGPITDLETIRQTRLARLVAQVLDLNRELQRKHPTVSHGKVIYAEGPDGRREPLDDTNIKLAIHRELVRVDQRIAALTGTDAAQRYELTASIGTADYETKLKALIERTNSITLMPRKPELAVIDAEVVEEERDEA